MDPLGIITDGVGGMEGMFMDVATYGLLIGASYVALRQGWLLVRSFIR